MADKILEKIKKLLELANNEAATENEAMVAMLKAQELMAKHGVSKDELGGEEESKKIISIRVEVEDVMSRCKNMKYSIPLILAICKNYRCECYLGGGFIYVLGFEEDAKIAVEVFKYAYAIIFRLGAKLVRQCYKEGRSAKGVHDSYAQGFLAGLKKALGKQSLALSIVVPQEVRQAKDAICNSSKSKEYKPNPNFVSSSFCAGMRDGEQFFNKSGLEGASN